MSFSGDSQGIGTSISKSYVESHRNSLGIFLAPLRTTVSTVESVTTRVTRLFGAGNLLGGSGMATPLHYAEYCLLVRITLTLTLTLTLTRLWFGFSSGTTGPNSGSRAPEFGSG